MSLIDSVYIYSVDLIDGKLEIVTKISSDLTAPPPAIVPYKIQKDVYEAVNGEIMLTKTIKGRQELGYFVPGKIIFDDK